MRIAPAARRSFAGRFAALSGRVQGTEPTKLFLALGRRPGLFATWLVFASRMMPRGTLPRRETELVILRVARLCGSDYEFEHHVRLGARVGVTDTDVARVIEGPKAPGWSARESAILRAVDALHRHRDLPDEVWSQLRVHLREPELVELVILAGHYEMLATFLTALRIAPDARRSPSPASSPAAVTG